MELRLTPKTLGCLTSDPARTNLGTGNLEIEWTTSKKASAASRLLQRELLPQQQRTCLHLPTPVFLLLNIMVNESCNKLHLPKNRACGRVRNQDVTFISCVPLSLTAPWCNNSSQVFRYCGDGSLYKKYNTTVPTPPSEGELAFPYHRDEHHEMFMIPQSLIRKKCCTVFHKVCSNK